MYQLQKRTLVYKHKKYDIKNKYKTNMAAINDANSYSSSLLMVTSRQKSSLGKTPLEKHKSPHRQTPTRWLHGEFSRKFLVPIPDDGSLTVFSVSTEPRNISAKSSDGQHNAGNVALLRHGFRLLVYSLVKSFLFPYTCVIVRLSIA